MEIILPKACLWVMGSLYVDMTVEAQMPKQHLGHSLEDIW